MMKIGLRELRKLHACNDAREQWRGVFPRGAELTYENVLKVVKGVYSSYIYWFLSSTVGTTVANRYDSVVRRADARSAYTDYYSQRHEYVARWLFKTLTANWDTIQKKLS